MKQVDRMILLEISEIRMPVCALFILKEWYISIREGRDRLRIPRQVKERPVNFRCYVTSQFMVSSLSDRHLFPD